jgi:hypothetical protein
MAREDRCFVAIREKSALALAGVSLLLAALVAHPILCAGMARFACAVASLLQSCIESPAYESTQSRGLRSDWTSYAGFLLNGMGVVMLGPLLPRLGHIWMLSDPQRGALLAAQFLGNPLGTILIRRRGRTAIVTGSLYSWISMSAIALLLNVSSNTKEIEFFACLSLFVFGFGLGQVITTLNLSVGEQARRPLSPVG